MPGFRPAPAPVGIEEKLGLVGARGERKGEGAGENDRLSGRDQVEVSDPFISDWLKRVESSYLRHQQHKNELKQHSMKVSYNHNFITSYVTKQKSVLMEPSLEPGSPLIHKIFSSTKKRFHMQAYCTRTPVIAAYCTRVPVIAGLLY